MLGIGPIGPAASCHLTRTGRRPSLLSGVGGGLHLPVHPWPRHLPQALIGSPRPPWRPLSDPDIDEAVTRLRAAGASLVAVSGHDSTPHTMGRFAAAFGAGFREVHVGDEIRVQSRS